MRTIPDPGFAGDDGAATPEVTAALAAYDLDPDHRHAATLAVLQHARLLVPVTAVVGDVEYDERGLAHDKSSDMATVLMQGQDGRMALLAFTGTDALRRWDPAGRPVPVSMRDAARAARHDGADALLLDVAGPVLFVVEGDELAALADGLALAELGERFGWLRTEHPDRG
ncbi:MAG TPA: SseB family protein [Marmoricola sp.]|nr:SseB family protein [Marmoricola sp.]